MVLFLVVQVASKQYKENLTHLFVSASYQELAILLENRREDFNRLDKDLEC